MNYSEYTLVSFGDSFCFGEGVTLGADLRTHEKTAHNAVERKKARTNYRKIANNHAYTKILEKILGFETSINCGIPGASNKRILNMLRSFTKNQHNDKCFYVIGLSHSVRDLIFTNLEDDPEQKTWQGYDFIYNSWNVTRKRKMKNGTRHKIYDMPHSAYMEMLLYYRNDFTSILDHIMTYHAIIDHLHLINAKYIIFDGINDLSHVMKNQRIAERVIHSEWVSNMMSEQETFKFEDTSDYIKSYYDELLNMSNPKYLNCYTIEHYYKDTSLKTFKGQKVRNMTDYVKLYPVNTDSPISGDEHWNKRGHHICAELLADWIRKHYDE